MNDRQRARIIIDTDLGGDPDDAMAIALAIASPELKIEGITTVYADVNYHARRVAKLLRLSGSGAIPIYNGLSETLLRNRNVWRWGPPSDKSNTGKETDGQEGDSLDGDETPVNAGHGVEFIVNAVMNNPGQITLIGIGPLTNIAAAIILEPLIAKNVKEIILMGGVTRLGDNGADLPAIEHNIQCDPEAASVVFSSRIPIVMVGLDVTRKVIVTRTECRRLMGSGKPANVVLADMIERWLVRIGEEATPMHDPLALALAIDRTLVMTRNMRVQIAYDHREGTGRTIAIPDSDGNVSVCLDVEADRFLQMLLDRLCG